MGVHDLWRLLAPTGHRLSLETLCGSRLAIDVSIWLSQFVKAMRDPTSGNTLPNAHLIGMLRRICRLLFHRIQPVFVFDGPAPSLKKQTLQQRLKQRQQARSTIERTAERLLLNQLKIKSLQMLKKRVAARGKQKQKEKTTSKNEAETGMETEKESDSIAGAVSSSSFSLSSGSVSSPIRLDDADVDEALAFIIASASKDSETAAAIRELEEEAEEEEEEEENQRRRERINARRSSNGINSETSNRIRSNWDEDLKELQRLQAEEWGVDETELMDKIQQQEEEERRREGSMSRTQRKLSSQIKNLARSLGVPADSIPTDSSSSSSSSVSFSTPSRLSSSISDVVPHSVVVSR